MRHIALVTTSYPDAAPGMEAAGSFVADFAAELSRRVRVTVVAASSQNGVSSDGNLRVRRFAVPRLPLSLLRPGNPAHWSDLISTMRAGQNAVLQMAAEDKPDHVLALWVLPSGYWVRRAARRHRFPYSVWALGSDIWSLGRVPVVRNILGSVARSAKNRYADGVELGDAFELISGSDCRFLPSTRRLPPVRDKVLATNPPFKLAYLGRWHPNKGTDLLLDAVRQLDDETWNRISELRFFGGGPQEPKVMQAVSDLRSEGRPLVVGGYLDKQGAADLIGWADYLLLPSRIESIPVIFSDAMQVGTPLIATPVGDLPKLHQKYDFGVVAKEISAESFADAMKEGLSAQPESFSDGIAIARADFDIQQVVDQFLRDTGMAG